jgi:hypothetical protein
LLFGGDLEISKDPDTGWTAAIASASPRRFSLLKLAHHGSQNGHRPELWSELIEPDSTGLLTPFRSGRHDIPTAEGVEELCGRLGALYTSASPKWSRKVSAQGALRRKLREHDTRLVEPETGMVRIRLAASGDLNIELFGRAEQFC